MATSIRQLQISSTHEYNSSKIHYFRCSWSWDWKIYRWWKGDDRSQCYRTNKSDHFALVGNYTWHRESEGQSEKSGEAKVQVHKPIWSLSDLSRRRSKCWHKIDHRNQIHEQLEFDRASWFLQKFLRRWERKKVMSNIVIVFTQCIQVTLNINI